MKWQGLIISAINITRLEPYQAPEKFLTSVIQGKGLFLSFEGGDSLSFIEGGHSS